MKNFIKISFLLAAIGTIIGVVLAIRKETEYACVDLEAEDFIPRY